MKRFIYFLIFVLLASSVSAVFIQKGTVLDPTGVNVSAIIGTNTTVNLTIVYSDGFGFNGDNFTFNLTNNSFVNITSLNFTSDQYLLDANLTTNYSMTALMELTSALDNNTVNITMQRVYAGTITATLDGTEVFSGTSGDITFNATTTPMILQITNAYNDLFDCSDSPGTFPSINFTLEDEDTGLPIIGDISVDLTYLDQVLSFEKQDVSFLTLCIGGGVNYTVTGTVRSEVAYLNKHFFIDAEFGSTMQTIKLYNFNDTTGISTLQWTVRDETWDVYPDIIGRMQRYYPANHTWVTVQQDQTGEFGQLIYHIKEESTEYRFYFYDGLNLLDSTNDVKFVCDSGLCEVTSQIIPSATPEVSIGANWTFNNDTKILTIMWNDPTGATSSVTTTLVKSTVTGNLLICNATTYTAVGSYACNTTGYSGNAILTIRSSASPEVIKDRRIITLTPLPKLADFLDYGESAIWTFGLSLTIMSLGITGSPLAVIVMLIFSLVIQMYLGISSIITAEFLGVATIIGIVVALKVKK